MCERSSTVPGGTGRFVPSSPQDSVLGYFHTLVQVADTISLGSFPSVPDKPTLHLNSNR
jgi:hypothetical protein